LASCGPDRLGGRVILSGSSTLGPLAQKAAEAWKAVHPGVDTRVEAIGSDAGLERLIRYGDADLALVSRPLTDADRRAAADAGLDLVPLALARDAVCLVVPSADRWAASLSRAQVVRAFTEAETWADLDPAYPAKPLRRFVLGPSSGTADVFAAALLGGDKARLYQTGWAQASEDDQILARGLAATPGALGFLGWTTFQSAGPGLRALAFDGVVPSPATIRNQSYGLTRPLWLVATRQGLDQKAEVRAFVRFLFDHYDTLTAGTGLVPLPEGDRVVPSFPSRTDRP